MKFYRKPKQKSNRKKLREDIGKIHLEILKIRRGEFDEIDGRPANGLGRFHILEISTNPKLEFVDENILLVNWLPHHFNWHHYGEGSPRNDLTLKRIKELRGEDYRATLRAKEPYIGTMNEMYLMALKQTMQKELAQLTPQRQG